MDATNRKILAELQADGRLSLTELAERVNLSLSPCHRRVHALEESGVIRGYRAQLDPGNVGLHFSAIVFVTLKVADQETMAAFESAVTEIPEIIDARRLFGTPDYMMSIVTEDLPAFQRLYDQRLSAMPGVQRLTSTIVMRQVVADRSLPI